jgi:hypothetical protein
MGGKLLSKSRYLSGLQCPKLLWVSVNEPNRLPPVDPATQYTFDQGHEVGKLAQQLFPGGIELPTDGFMANIKQTRDTLALRRPLFEAGFMAGRLFCRVDVLTPDGDDGWDITEVKSTTEVKEEQRQDIAFQRHVCTRAGLNIRHCCIMHINNRYIKQGELDPGKFFIIEDVTDSLDDYSAGLEDSIDEMLSCLEGEEPGGIIGRRCNDPYDCGLQDECWAGLPDHHVMTLASGKKLGEELLRRGILAITEIPDDVPLNAKQRIQRNCLLCGKPHLNPAELKAFLKKLVLPLYFLDFESFQTAIPRYDGTRPYQQIPFQFSLHVYSGDGEPLSHRDYLADGPADPRPGLLNKLGEAIGTAGSVVAYNAAFESRLLQDAADAFPAHQPWIGDVLGRVVDLMAPFRGFLYYHPSQGGSYSIKKVLPALTGISYDGLDIGEGSQASLMYMESIFGAMDETERQEIRCNLETYCGQDTEGMVRIVEKLREILNPHM